MIFYFFTEMFSLLKRQKSILYDFLALNKLQRLYMESYSA
jgi:hypothetical protein